jgi:hypothetical protein
MTGITGVITQVIERWPTGNGWVVEVEVFAAGSYHRTDMYVFTEREAKAIRRGAEITIPEVIPDRNPSDEIPF